jgi:ubiquinone biosynthesis protein
MSVGGRDARALGRKDRDGPEAGGRSPLRIAENTREDPASACRESTGSSPARRPDDEWIDGISLSDVEALRAAGHDLPALGRNVIQSFLRHALRDGFFHADMHPGNLFVEAQGRLVAVDLGIMGRLGKKERRFLAEILSASSRRDYRRVAEVHFEAGYVPPHPFVDAFAQAIRADRRADPRPAGRKISMARLLTLLFEVTEMFDMATRHRARHAAEDHGRGRGRRPQA